METPQKSKEINDEPAKITFTLRNGEIIDLQNLPSTISTSSLLLEMQSSLRTKDAEIHDLTKKLNRALHEVLRLRSKSEPAPYEVKPSTVSAITTTTPLKEPATPTPSKVATLEPPASPSKRSAERSNTHINSFDEAEIEEDRLETFQSPRKKVVPYPRTSTPDLDNPLARTKSQTFPLAPNLLSPRKRPLTPQTHQQTLPYLARDILGSPTKATKKTRTHLSEVAVKLLQLVSEKCSQAQWTRAGEEMGFEITEVVGHEVFAETFATRGSVIARTMTNGGDIAIHRREINEAKDLVELFGTHEEQHNILRGDLWVPMDRTLHPAGKVELIVRALNLAWHRRTHELKAEFILNVDRIRRDPPPLREQDPVEVFKGLVRRRSVEQRRGSLDVGNRRNSTEVGNRRGSIDVEGIRKRIE